MSTKHSENHAIVAVAAPLQVLLYGGDRFLAANIEAIRAAASATATDAQAYRFRAHKVVSELNPCHEDNYWIGNASVSWGGAEDLGFELLHNAVHCRFWDEWPAFFYAFNQSFFLQNVDEARKYAELAAQRSSTSTNAAAFRTFSTMLAAGKLDNTKMALEMLKNERDKAREPQLREMLEKRVRRLQGLITLRKAHTEYEKRFSKPLVQPKQLLQSGILDTFPHDPLGIGYVFQEQTFQLGQRKFQ